MNRRHFTTPLLFQAAAISTSRAADKVNDEVRITPFAAGDRNGF
jgi:hypothetical protein